MSKANKSYKDRLEIKSDVVFSQKKYMSLRSDKQVYLKGVLDSLCYDSERDNVHKALQRALLIVNPTVYHTYESHVTYISPDDMIEVMKEVKQSLIDVKNNKLAI